MFDITKTCSTCKTEQTLDNFSRRTDRPGVQFDSRCFKCHAERSRKYRERPHVKERMRLWQQAYMAVPENREKRREKARSPEGQSKRRTYAQTYVAKKLSFDYRLYKINGMLGAARRRARAKGIDFCITREDVPGWRELEFCPVFKTIRIRWDHDYFADDSPTLDRIDPKLGYILGNVRVICWRANRLKSDATLAELEAVYRDALLHDK